MGNNVKLTAINELLQLSLDPKNGLDIATARDIIDKLKQGTNDPQQTATIRKEVEQASKYWSPEALGQLRNYFNMVDISPKQSLTETKKLRAQYRRRVLGKKHSGIWTPPVVSIKGKGYYIPPKGEQAEVYLDKKQEQYERISQTAANGNVQTPDSGFAGFFDSMQAYLNNLPGEKRKLVNQFAASHPKVWKRIYKNNRFDLIAQVLEMKGGRNRFSTMIYTLCQREGYVVQQPEARENGEWSTLGAMSTFFDNKTLPIGLSAGHATHMFAPRPLR